MNNDDYSYSKEGYEYSKEAPTVLSPAYQSSTSTQETATATGPATMQPPPPPPRQHSYRYGQTPPPPPPPPKQSKFGFGFSMGCLTAVILLCIAPFFALFSCAGMVESAIEAAESSFEGSGSSDSAVLRPGNTSRQIAVISIRGVIARSFQSSFMSDEQGAGSIRICREIREAIEDDSVVGIILDMDTPGGEVVASDEIRKAVDQCRKAGKNVVTCIHTAGASGGYFIASGSDWIVANSMSLTGSVGVIMSGMQYTGLMEKIGVKPKVYRSGNFKDIGSGSREATPAEEAYLNALIQETFQQFCQVIADGRPQYFKDAQAVRNAEFGDGRPVSGAMALKLKLIDQLGDFDTAVAKARELTGVSDAAVVRRSSKSDWVDRLFSMAMRQPELKIQGITDTTLPEGRLFFLMTE